MAYRAPIRALLSGLLNWLRIDNDWEVAARFRAASSAVGSAPKPDIQRTIHLARIATATGPEAERPVSAQEPSIA